MIIPIHTPLDTQGLSVWVPRSLFHQLPVDCRLAFSIQAMYPPAGCVGFVPDPEHAMAPHATLLVVRIKLFIVRDAEAFPLTCILNSSLVELYVILPL